MAVRSSWEGVWERNIRGAPLDPGLTPDILATLISRKGRSRPALATESSGPDQVDLVGLQLPVMGDEGQILDTGLGDQHAVEGVAMVLG